MDGLQQALVGLEDYDLLGPQDAAEATRRLERIAQTAAGAEIRSEDLRLLAQWVMDEHWVADGLPETFLAPRRAHVLLRLTTLFEQIQTQRRDAHVFVRPSASEI